MEFGAELGEPRSNSPGGLQDCYLDICSELNQPANPYILHMVRETDRLPSGNLYGGFTLKLNGNLRHFLVQRLMDKDAAALVPLLHNNVYITGLDLSFNNLTNCGAEIIANLLLETTVLTDLSLMCNEIGSNGAEWLAKALHLNKSLKNLRMNGNKIGNKGGMQFATMLQLNRTLESLDLGDCDLGIQSLIAFATVLNNNMTLRALNIGRPLLYSLQEEVTVHMAHMLQVNQTLQQLHLENQAMKNFGAEQICEKLVTNQTLRLLNLRCNQISCDGAKAFAELLKHNTPLKILDLAANRIEDKGLVYISEALRYLNDQLTGLSVVSNSITGVGLVALANALKSNKTLTNVYIWGNELDESACSDFANLLKVGRLKPKDTDISPYWIDGHVHLAQLAHGLQMYYYWTPPCGEQDAAACNASLILLKEPQVSISQIDIEEIIESSSTGGGHSAHRLAVDSLKELSN